MPRGFGPPAAERHPRQREEFRVLRGTLDLGTIDGARVLLRAGETFSLPAGKYHRPLNAGDDELEFEATLTPGLDAAEMFASLYAATRELRALRAGGWGVSAPLGDARLRLARATRDALRERALRVSTLGSARVKARATRLESSSAAARGLACLSGFALGLLGENASRACSRRNLPLGVPTRRF